MYISSRNKRTNFLNYLEETQKLKKKEICITMKILPLYHHFLEQTNVTFGVGACIDRSHGIRGKQRKRGKGLRGTRNGGKKDPMGNGSNNLSGPDCRFEAQRGDRTPFPTVNPIHRLVCPQW